MTGDHCLPVRYLVNGVVRGVWATQIEMNFLSVNFTPDFVEQDFMFPTNVTMPCKQLKCRAPAVENPFLMNAQRILTLNRY